MPMTEMMVMVMVMMGDDDDDGDDGDGFGGGREATWGQPSQYTALDRVRRQNRILVKRQRILQKKESLFQSAHAPIKTDSTRCQPCSIMIIQSKL